MHEETQASQAPEQPKGFTVRRGEKFVHRGMTFAFVGQTHEGLVVAPTNEPIGSRKARRAAAKAARKLR